MVSREEVIKRIVEIETENGVLKELIKGYESESEEIRNCEFFSSEMVTSNTLLITKQLKIIKRNNRLLSKLDTILDNANQ